MSNPATPWTIAHQASLSMGFPRQRYWSELSFPSTEDLPDPGNELMSPTLAGGFFTTEPLGKPLLMFILNTWEFPDGSVLGCQAFTAEAAGALNPGQGLSGLSC